MQGQQEHGARSSGTAALTARSMPDGRETRTGSNTTEEVAAGSPTLLTHGSSGPSQLGSPPVHAEDATAFSDLPSCLRTPRSRSAGSQSIAEPVSFLHIDGPIDVFDK